MVLQLAHGKPHTPLLVVLTAKTKIVMITIISNASAPPRGAVFFLTKTVKTNKGFTLIELMIVVAIIGILAAIAIPAYQDYIARSQITRTVGEISELKTPIEAMLVHGRYPVSGAEVGYTNSNLVGSDQNTLESGLTLDFTSGDGSGFIRAILNGEVVPSILGAQVLISRAPTGTWTCVVIAPAVPGWQDNFAPAGCPAS